MEEVTVHRSDSPLLGLMNQSTPAPLRPRPTDLTPLICQATELPAKSQTASHALSQSVTSQPPAGVETTGMWQCTLFVDTHTLLTTLKVVRHLVTHRNPPGTEIRVSSLTTKKQALRDLPSRGRGRVGAEPN